MYAKKEKIKIEDSNMAWYGSDMHKDVRLSAAQSEKEFKGAGSKPGIEIWRVEKLAIKRWPTEKHGQFHTGDAFIVLYTYQQGDNDKLMFNAHFWLGAECSQDEGGVAAYKTVELDDLLGDAPVQYREVQGNESQRFRKLFPQMQILAGGVESGFTKVVAATYQARLLHVQGKESVCVTMVPLAASSLNDGDVFLLDNGMKLYQWNGRKSNPMERRKCDQLVKTITVQRGSEPESEILDGMEEHTEFWALLGGKPAGVAEAISDEGVEAADRLYLIKSTSKGEMELKLMGAGAVDKKLLDAKGVFLFDVGYQIFIWLGKQAPRDEKKRAMLYAMNYIRGRKLAVTTPVVRIVQGGICPEFDAHFGFSGHYVVAGSSGEGKDTEVMQRQQGQKTQGLGAIKIVVLEAKELHNTQWLGKQDPFAKVQFGKVKFRTKTHVDGKLEAKWEPEPFFVGLTGDPELDDDDVFVEVGNDNMLIDARIGEVAIPVKGIMAQKGECVENWYDLVRKGDQPAGKLLIQTQFIPPLVVKVLSATVRNVQLIGKQDPYCKLEIGQFRFRSGIHDNGGKEPVWKTDNEFCFNPCLIQLKKKQIDKGEVATLRVQVKDDNYIRDASIGWGFLPLPDLEKQVNQAPFELPLVVKEGKDKSAGVVVISVSTG